MEEEIVEIPEPKKVDKRSVSSKANIEKARAKAIETKAAKKAAIKKVELSVEQGSDDELYYKVPGKKDARKEKLYKDVEDMKLFMDEWRNRKASKKPVLKSNEMIHKLGEKALHGTPHNLTTLGNKSGVEKIEYANW